LRIPVWLLRLLPMWDYICPKCRKEVKKNSCRCPHCGEHYGQPVRLPPEVLKDAKALEDYVHRHIFPRISRAQRDYLAQWFTELFSDGFESGDFSAWTGTNGTPSIVGTPVHHGSYAMAADASGDYAYKTFTEQSTIYVRLYVRFDTQMPTGDDFRFLDLLDGGSSMMQIRFEDSSGTTRVGVSNWVSGAAGNVELLADTWYCVEVYFLSAVAGEYKVYIDEVEVVSKSGIDTSARVCDTVRVGRTATDYALTNYVDCVVVADTYIGPETTEQTYTKTWATDALFKKLGITETLSVDAALQKQDIPKTFGLDAAFQKSLIIQKQTDALFKRFDIPKSFAVDARFGALVTQTVSRQIDVLLKKLDATKTFGLDAYFGPAEAQAYTKTFALDVTFAYKVRLPELWLDENGKMVLNISKPYTWVGT
jgi:hypothetical protein